MGIRHRGDLAQDPALYDLVRCVPPVLYRYSALAGDRLEWIRQLLVESRLYFASPATFNDPFDCRITPNFEASELAREQFWRLVVREHFPNGPMRLDRDRIRRMAATSRTPAGREGLTQEIFKALHAAGVLCLSADPASTLMWSYYADGHRGVALRFRTDIGSLARLGSAVGPFIPLGVKYQRAFPSLNYFKSTTADLVFTLLGAKSADWAHEQEWRLVLPHKQGLFTIPPALVDGVVLGMRIPADVESAIRTWVQARSPSIELLRVANRPNSFDLELMPA
jgi:hypothetical protein